MPNYFIFRCSNKTYQECIDRMLVGQQSSNQTTPVSIVKINDIIFLHKTSSIREIEKQFIEGPFFAISNGTQNIEPQAWHGGFPWQVKIEKRGTVSKIEQPSFNKFLNYSLELRFFNFQIDSNIGRHLMAELGLEVNIVENKVDNYEPLDNIDIDIRLRYSAKFRCDDGHYVRSKNEVIIDNWLFAHNIAHGYEKKIIGLNMLCDFYIKNKIGEPVYIEIWGLNDEKYLKRKKEKEN